MRRAVVLALLLGAGCGGGEAIEPPGGKPSGAWVGLAAALAAPTAVDAWTISGEPRGGSYFAYPESSRRTPVDSANIRALTSILSDPKSFSKDYAPCSPRPGVKVCYARKGAEPIWVFFCFECGELFVYEGSMSREHLPFYPSVVLNGIMKKIFPRDTEIQNLK